jgi:sortase (surface protein transpeptidase)
MSAVITKAMNAYEKNIEERQASVAQIKNEYSRKYFNHSNASLGEIRIEAVKRNLEVVFSHS